MEGKKISFGFMKTKKADKLIPDNNDDKKDYIECVEEQSIKIVGGDKPSSNEPLVIPMKPNSLIKPERLREIALKVEGALEEPSIKIEPMEDDSATDPLAENETLEQMAVRELMQDSKKEVKIENPTIAIPTSTKGIADGETESTLDDYDAVPVQEFGVAMLRGMGWTPGQASSNYKQPELRPKGLGLGADKVIKAKPEASKDSKQEELVILKNSYVKIVCGKYSDYYGKVVSLDEDNGRVMVEIPLKKETVSLSEFMMHAVTKSEYDKESKVIRKHKGSHMSVDKKQEIIELYEKKVPVRNIARKLNVARNTVYLWIKRWEQEGDLNAHIPSGRPRKLSADEEALLIKQVGQTTQANVSDLTANHADRDSQCKKKQRDILEQNFNITKIVDLKIELEEIDSKQSEDLDHKMVPVKDKREQIMTLYEQNHTIAEIARRLNIAKKAVHLCIKCSKFQRSGKDGNRPKVNQKKITGLRKHQSDVEIDDGTSIATSTTAITKRCKENRRVEESSTELHEITVVKEKKEKNVDEKLLKLNTRLSEVKKEKIIALYKQKHPIAEIAERLKIARYAADLWIKRWKRESTNKRQISFGRPQKLSADDEAILLKEAAKQAENISLSDLANNYGVSKATIRRYLRHNGIPFKQSRQTVIKGIPEETTCTESLEENEERSKTKNDHISVDKKIQIVNLYEQKHTISAIARHLKVSKNTVRLWIRRWQEEGTIEPHLPSGRPRKLTSDVEAVLKDQVLEGGPLRMTSLASRHGVSTTTIRRCLRDNGLNTKLQQREREEKKDRSVKHGFQDLYCNTVGTEFDKDLEISHHKYQVATKTVCDGGISLNKDSDLGSNPVGTRAVCDLGTSQESGQNLCSKNTVVANGTSECDQTCTIEIKIESD